MDKEILKALLKEYLEVRVYVIKTTDSYGLEKHETEVTVLFDDEIVATYTD